ncbi:MAG: hypothetical protein K6C68_05090, partial [Ruminococcus sp.]|nr:hypothetical protein [Ruminococcus sp.]
MGLDLQKNNLHYYVDLLRMKNGENRSSELAETCVTALHNIIRTMRFSRHDKICREDFSQLDFGNIILNNLYFSDNGQEPSSFKGSKMSEWNIHGGMIGYLYYADFSDDEKSFITICNDGKAIVWDIETNLMKKVISISKPFVMWIDDIEDFVDLSKPKTFEYKLPEFDVDKVKEELLSDYFFEKQVRSIISDDVKIDIINRFKEYNKAKFNSLFSNNE